MSLAEPFYPNYLASDPADPRAEAHRLCRVALKAGPATGRSLVVRVGCRFTLVVGASDGRLVGFRSVSHGPVLLAASHAEAANANGAAAARVVRAAAGQVAERARLESLVSAGGAVVGATGIAETVIALAARGASQATVDEVRAVTETLGAHLGRASAGPFGQLDCAHDDWRGRPGRHPGTVGRAGDHRRGSPPPPNV